MRRSWQTMEVIILFGLFADFIYEFKSAFSVKELTIGLNVLMASIIISRSIFKRNRGLFGSSLLKVSAELIALLSALAWNRYAFMKLNLSPMIYLECTIALACIFAFGRALSKNIGVKTQVMFK